MKRSMVLINLACFQHWFSFLQAEIQNLEYWLPSANTFTSQHSLSPYIAPSTGFGHLYLQFWLACPHNGAEVYLCNPCSSKKETRVRGCSSTLRLRSCVCLPSIQFWLSVHFFALLLSYLLGALVLQRFNLISTNPLNSPKYMYVNPLPHNGFWMCLVYLILGCFIVRGCDSCTRWLTLSAPYEIICCRIKERICCFIMVSSNQNALLCRSCQAPPVPTSSTKTCGSLATNLHCVVKSCQISLLTTQMLAEKKSPFTVESKGLANEISPWEGGWRMVKLKSHDKKQGEARCEGEHGGRGCGERWDE